MIFALEPEIIDAEETGDNFIVTQVQDIGPTLELCRNLREHDETKGWTRERKFKHIASIPEVTESILLKTRPEVFRDKTGKEMLKWLKTDEGRMFRVSPEAAPVNGNGLQVIIR